MDKQIALTAEHMLTLATKEACIARCERRIAARIDAEFWAAVKAVIQEAEMKTLTVARLIELLEGEDPNAKVIFSTNYGDYSRTEQALPLKGEFDTVGIVKSAYSNSGFAVTEPGDDSPDEDGYEPTDAERAQANDTYLVIR